MTNYAQATSRTIDLIISITHRYLSSDMTQAAAYNKYYDTMHRLVLLHNHFALRSDGVPLSFMGDYIM